MVSNQERVSALILSLEQLNTSDSPTDKVQFVQKNGAVLESLRSDFDSARAACNDMVRFAMQLQTLQDSFMKIVGGLLDSTSQLGAVLGRDFNEVEVIISKLVAVKNVMLDTLSKQIIGPVLDMLVSPLESLCRHCDNTAAEILPKVRQSLRACDDSQHEKLKREKRKKWNSRTSSTPIDLEQRVRRSLRRVRALTSMSSSSSSSAAAETAANEHNKIVGFQENFAEYLISLLSFKQQAVGILFQTIPVVLDSLKDHFADGVRYVDQVSHDFDTIGRPFYDDFTQKCRSDNQRLNQIVSDMQQYNGVGSKSSMALSPAGGFSGIIKRQGFLKKQTKGVSFKQWPSRKVVLRRDLLLVYHADVNRSPASISMLTSHVKRLDEPEYAFQVTNPMRSYKFVAHDSNERELWLEGLLEVQADLLKQKLSDPAQSQGAKDLLGEIAAGMTQYLRHENVVCADCDAPNPQWMSVNMGAVLCIDCIGCHRGLGANVSQPRSLVLDVILPSNLLIAVEAGNELINGILEAELGSGMKPLPHARQEQRERFIIDKYQKFQFVAKHNVLPLTGAFIRRSIERSNVGDLLLALASGFDLSAPICETSGATPLHWAVHHSSSDNLHIIEFLLRNACRYDSHRLLTLQDNSSRTPLHQCVVDDRLDALKMLLRFCDCDATGRSSTSSSVSAPDLSKPSDISALNKAKQQFSTGKTCLALRDTDGKTPIELARQLNRNKCLEILNCFAEQIDGRRSRDQVAIQLERLDFDHYIAKVSIAQDATLDQSTLEAWSSEDDLEHSSESRTSPLNSESRARHSDALLLLEQSASARRRNASLFDRKPPVVASSSVAASGSVVSSSTSSSTARNDALLMRTISPESAASGSSSAGGGSGGAGGGGGSGGGSQVDGDRTPTTNGRSKKGLQLSSAQRGRSRTQLDTNGAIRSGASSLAAQAAAEARARALSLPPDVLNLTTGLHQISPSQTYAESRANRQPNYVRCVAVFDCTADNSDELSFSKGELILKIREHEENGWWVGFRQDNPSVVGLFPITYVRTMD